ncbi:MAG TPA: glycoside hydrolase family 2 TIM barrel-domain containing protein [Ilumatobacteraceae bacterium]|nr:glycoside hydrolase family 2 TIM barrel-domain containing protein [Ilumatobacteraceae bacterium]
MDPTHPSPFLQRDWTSLDGRWACTIDPDGVHRTPHDPPFADAITVPFAPETPASGIGTTDAVETIWYRRRLGLDAPGPGERLLVHFGGVDRIADVWIDGQHVGHHVGGYAPFSVDVTDHVHPDAQLVVRVVDDAHDLEVPRGKQEWGETPHSVWYPRTTGIWKTVWAERVPETRIAAIDWHGEPAAMTVSVRVRIEGPLPHGLRLRIRLQHRERVLVDDDLAVTGRTVERTMAVGDGGFDDRIQLLWWPTRPNLFDAQLVLHADDGLLDEVASYTALRSVDVDDGRFRINGRPYRLRLVLDQGYWPDTGATPPDVDALRRDVELTKALGFNGARKHQKTEDPRYFALADQLGLLTWVEMPSAYRPGPRTAANLLGEWAAVVDAHRNHPSVVAWVPINESWGVPDCANDPNQRALIEALAAMTDALDGTRPVSANDGWETVGGGIVGVHDYDQDPAALTARWGDADAVDAVLTGRRPDGLTADLDQVPAGRRAVVLSEFGGIALDDDATAGAIFGSANWGYDAATSPDDLLRRYREQWAVVHASTALSGACWTQLTDAYQEVNGLLRADRTPKADLAAFASATRGRPAPATS